MSSKKLTAEQAFPKISVSKLGGGELDLTTPANGFDWRMVVVYRGKHCPLCTKCLNQLNEILPQLHELGIDAVAVSADPIEKVEEQMQLVNPKFEVGYDLSISQMEQLGLYISTPRSDVETDRPFAYH